MIRKIMGAWLIATLVVVLAVPVLAGHIELPHQTTNCAFDGDTQFKYEIDGDNWEESDPGIDLTLTYSDEGEVVDASAPDGWTIMCAKVPQPDKGAGISHIIVVQDPPDDPELDCDDEEYANRNPDECEQGPDPTVPDPTTSTTVVEPTTTAPPTTVPPTTEPPTTEPPTTQPAVTTPVVLPFTGPSGWLIPAGFAALGMLILGSLVAWVFRDRLSN